MTPPGQTSPDLPRLMRILADYAGSCANQLRSMASGPSSVSQRRHMSEEESTLWLSSGIEGRSQGRLRDFFDAPVLPTAAPLPSSESDYTWVMNPVDGVGNLLHGIEHASVSFALLWRGLPILGVIADVFGGRQYMAAHGEGAWIQDERLGSEPQLLPELRQEHLSSSILTFALPEQAEYSASVFRAAAKLFSERRDLRHRGVPSLDLVNVAACVTQGHFQRGISTALLAPAAVILREAGVHLTDWSGDFVVFPSKSERLDVAAGRDPVFREMLDVLVKIRI